MVGFGFSTNAGPNVENNDDDGDWMVRFNKAKLMFGSSGEGKAGNSQCCDVRTLAVDFDIHRTGGHLLIGSNGSGKSLLFRSMIYPESVRNIAHGDNEKRPVESVFSHRNVEDSRRPLVSHVSFESHQQLLHESETSPHGSMTTYAALSPGGHFSKTAEFLVVRFGLLPLLYRDVTTLSNGEIRKVLLIRALVQQPRILILDNAFDGLDVASRSILKDIVRKTIAGFRMDILVQGVSAHTVPATQVILATHRMEEVVDNISRVSVIDDKGTLVTYDQETPYQLDRQMRDESKFSNSDTHELWNGHGLPTVDALRSILAAAPQSGDRTDPLVKMIDMDVKAGDEILLSNLTWTINQGERWVIAGGNGAGKSTLSRLLAHPLVNHKGLETTLNDAEVGWVSTERHVQLSKSDRIVEDILFENCKTKDERLLDVVLQCFDLHDSSVRMRPFARLSQGQQKMVLIANGLLKATRLLILDEPLQGLDLINRRKVLGLVERWCQSSDMSFVYITHHLEETIPSIQSVLHLAEGRVVYSGDFASYDPDLF
jgi:molybdate transport system ATP-binding protein